MEGSVGNIPAHQDRGLWRDVQEIFLLIRRAMEGCVGNIPAHQDRGLWRDV